DSDIRNLVSADRDARRPHAERPAGVLLAVDAGRVEHRGMYHAGAEDFDPPRALARRAPDAAADAALHVHLGRGLGEREVGRAEASARRAEEALREDVERGLEVDEADAFVDAEPFDLLERRRMRGVEWILAIDLAGNEHANGRRVFLERPHLHRRGVGAE